MLMKFCSFAFALYSLSSLFTLSSKCMCVCTCIYVRVRERKDHVVHFIKKKKKEKMLFMSLQNVA